MTKKPDTILVVGDPHAHPDHDNKRADYLGNLILDIRPDVVVNMGDTADMPSLSAYDKGKRSFEGRRYSDDIECHLDFQERMWRPIRKAKKKQPYSVILEGNHEHRVERALDLSPELQGTIGFEDFRLNDYYDKVARYQGGTPAVVNIAGINFAHYFVTGVMGRPTAGLHPAYSLVSKQLTSSVQGHTHVLDYSLQTSGDGSKVFGLVAGCYFDYNADWAGVVNSIYWRGVIVLRQHSDSRDDNWNVELIDMNTMRNTYG